MKTFKCFRIGIIGIVALLTFGFATKGVCAINAYLYISDSTDKVTKVKINPDGSFTTPPLHAGTYRWSFGATQAGAKSTSGTGQVAGSTGGSNTSSSLRLNFTKITMTYTIAAPKDIATGLASGKRMHKPFTITKELDMSSPKMMTNLGTFDLDASGETLTGTVSGLKPDGGKSAMDDWEAR